ncbi:MAG: hypothetical protein ACQGVK_15935 [Myxococcota bacterium]
MRVAVLASAISLVLAVPAHAYDSKCYIGVSATKCADGPQAARNRWFGPDDEHREIFERTRALAELPDALDRAVDLRVFIGPDDIEVAGTPEPSLVPVDLLDATRAADRTLAIAELAQLPDFSYALWDWAVGNESCPLEPALGRTTSAAKCHAFESHMGPVNSNHFLPQAQHFYAYYHELALGRAGACLEMGRRIEDGGRDVEAFRPYLEACERQALALEAVGHHFMQDSWSMGHMWERWGSPDLADFATPVDGILVAMTTGILHGARSVLAEKAPFTEGVFTEEVNDAMCAAAPEVRWRRPFELESHAGIGDLYLHDLLGDPAHAEQADRMFACAVDGLREVYAASGEWHGPMGPRSPGLPAVFGTDCFEQRATNAALHRGFGIDYTGLDGQAVHLPLTPALASLLLPAASSYYGKSLDPVDFARRYVRYGRQMTVLASRLALRAHRDPEGTDLASGGMGALVGVEPNSAYVPPSGPLAPYLDPPLPWDPGAGIAKPGVGLPPESDRGVRLARLFHRAHAIEWCEAVGDVEDLARRVDDLKEAGAIDEEIATACEICSEFVARHLRVGSDAGDYDTDREPLCALVADDPTGVSMAYTEGEPDDEIDELAARWCGCAEGCHREIEGDVLANDDESMRQLAGVRRIKGDALVGVDAANLAPLACLEQVDGKLTINPWRLEDLSGLESLRTVGSLYIGGGSPRLRSLAGLESLEGPVQDLRIGNLPKLESLDGLEGITAVNGSLAIGDLPSLENTHGLRGIERLGHGHQQEICGGGFEALEVFELASLVTAELYIECGSFEQRRDSIREFHLPSLRSGEISISGYDGEEIGDLTLRMPAYDSPEPVEPDDPESRLELHGVRGRIGVIAKHLSVSVDSGSISSDLLDGLGLEIASSVGDLFASRLGDSTLTLEPAAAGGSGSDPTVIQVWDSSGTRVDVELASVDQLVLRRNSGPIDLSFGATKELWLLENRNLALDRLSLGTISEFLFVQENCGFSNFEANAKFEGSAPDDATVRYNMSECAP